MSQQNSDFVAAVKSTVANGVDAGVVVVVTDTDSPYYDSISNAMGEAKISVPNRRASLIRAEAMKHNSVEFLFWPRQPTTDITHGLLNEADAVIFIDTPPKVGVASLRARVTKLRGNTNPIANSRDVPLPELV